MKMREGKLFPGWIHRNWRYGGVVSPLLAMTLLWGGCAEDLLGAFGNTTIDGLVVDNVGDPIFGVPIGVVYEAVPLSGPSPPSRLAPEAVTLRNPYPNPSFGSLSIPIQADGPTVIQVELRGNFAGGSGSVALIFTGTVTKDTTVTWGGQDNLGGEVANGLYFVRLTSPPGSSDGQSESAVILNRSAAQMITDDIFNTVSAVDGSYLIDDIGVEQQFTATDQTGNSLGERVTRDRVTLAFRDPDYQPRDVLVSIGKGETVEIETPLFSLSPSPSVFE